MGCMVEIDGAICYREGDEVVLNRVPERADGSFVIPDEVTIIGDNGALFGCAEITSLTVSKSVREISKGALNCCEAVKEFKVVPENPHFSSDEQGVLFSKDKTVLLRAPMMMTGAYKIPVGVEKIDDEAFCGCDLLTEIEFPEGLTHIGEDVFGGCDKISKVFLPASLEEIGEQALSNCRLLEKIEVHEDNKNYSSDGAGVLFSKDKTLIITAPPQLCGEYEMPDTVIELLPYSFRMCGKLTKVTLSKNLEEISYAAFADCGGLEEVVFVEGLSYISEYAFAGCGLLRQVCTPESLTNVGPMSFYRCVGLESVGINKNVIDVSHLAFCGCKKLNQIYVHPENTRYLTDESGVLMDSAKTTILLAPCGLEGRYIFPDSVRRVMPNAFDECKEFTEVVISLAAADMDLRVFDRCKKLERIYMKDPIGIVYDKKTLEIVKVWSKIEKAELLEGVPKIERLAFEKKGLLESVSIPESVTEIGRNAFYGCDKLKKITVSEKNELFHSGDHGELFYKKWSDYQLLRLPPAVKGSYQVPDGVTKIAERAFEGCKDLVEVIFPESLKEISMMAFEGCENLERAVFRSKNTGVRFGFEGCKKLTIYGPSGGGLELDATHDRIPFVATE